MLSHDFILLASRVGFLAGNFALTIGFWVQVLKIYRTRSAKDFSWALLASLFACETLTWNYGFQIKEWPIIIIASLNLPATLLAIRGYLLFGRKI